MRSAVIAEVDHLSGDVPVHRMAAETTAAIGADQVWRGVLSGSGRYTGAGIGIAVVDSGIAHGPVAQRSGGRHRGLHRERSRSARMNTATGRTSRGSSPAPTPAYPGVAPGALAGEPAGARAATARARPATSSRRSTGRCEHRARVQPPHHQPVARASGARTGGGRSALPGGPAGGRRRGILVVAAAGNFGKTADGRPIVGGIVSPGNAPAALTVGALNTKGTVAALATT